jgi:plasmid stability protein
MVYMLCMEGTADIVVRGVDEELVRRVRVLAVSRGQSLKEYVVEVLTAALGGEAIWEELLAREGVNVPDGVSSGMRGNVGKRGKGRDTASVRSTRARKPPSESGAVDGGAQQDRGGKGKGETSGQERSCPKCGKPLIEWGNQLNCKGCRQNFPK